MIINIIFGILIFSFIIFLIERFVNLPFLSFKKILKYIIFILILIFVFFLIRFNPNFLSLIPALFVFLFKWRSLIFFLRNVFFSTKRSKFSTKNIMTKKEALEILGLNEGASKKEIIDSYHTLLKKNHPDLGGSDWITSQLNKAKETLLG